MSLQSEALLLLVKHKANIVHGHAQSVSNWHTNAETLGENFELLLKAIADMAEAKAAYDAEVAK